MPAVAFLCPIYEAPYCGAVGTAQYARNRPAGQRAPSTSPEAIATAKNSQSALLFSTMPVETDQSPGEPGKATTEPPVDGPTVTLAKNVYVPHDALRFTFVASRGPGGQNVNKRATCAQLRVRILDIPISSDARSRLRRLAGARFIAGGEILLTADEFRSQIRNRQACIDRLSELVTAAIRKPKARKPTKPSRSAVRRRLEEKKQRGETKRRRRPPKRDEAGP